MNEFKKYKIAVVVPTHIQPTDQFIQSLQASSKDADVIIVKDTEQDLELPADWQVYGYAEQEEMLGDYYEAFQMFQHSSSVRNFGHWVAYMKGYDIVIALDNDCLVGPNFIADHLKALTKVGWGWENPLEGTGWFARGFPYHERRRRIVANVGLWSNEIDVNGKDRVEKGTPPKEPVMKYTRIAQGMTPFCGMNTAFWSDAIPAILFLPNFKYFNGQREWKFSRHDDIWGGYIFQKLMKLRDERLTYGQPWVFHDTIVDAQDDAAKEEGMNAFEYEFFTMVDNVIPSIESGMYDDMFQEFVDKINLTDSPFQEIVPALNMWKRLFMSLEAKVKE